MPDWTYTTSTSSIWVWDDDGVMYINGVSGYTQQMWEEHLEKERKEEIKRKQIAEDKVKYPLFFLKEGIV